MQLRKAGLMIERAQCRPQKWISYNYIYIITTICGVFLAASIFSKPGWHHKCLECRAQEIVIIGSLGIQKWWDGPLLLGWKINLYLDSWSLMIVFDVFIERNYQFAAATGLLHVSRFGWCPLVSQHWWALQTQTGRFACVGWSHMSTHLSGSRFDQAKASWLDD